MASGEEYPEFVLDLLRDVPVIAHRKMMGEYLRTAKRAFRRSLRRQALAQGHAYGPRRFLVKANPL